MCSSDLENILTDAQVTEIETVIFPAFDSLEKKEKIKVLHRQIRATDETLDNLEELGYKNNSDEIKELKRKHKELKSSLTKLEIKL